jgi:hypothetical protein
MSMRKILFATLATAAVFAAAPASAQFYLGAGPGGAGVQVGPLGVGVGPRFGGYRSYDYDYGPGYGCPLVRERFVTPRGHVVYRTRRACY